MSSVIEARFLFLSTQEAAEALGITDGRVRQLLREGLLRGHKLGEKNWAIPPSEIERFRRARRPPGRPKHHI